MSSSKSKDIPPSSFLIPLSTALLYVGNMWYAVIKKSLASSTPLMQKELGITATDIGEFSASFSLCYGLFKLVGGLLSDIYPVCTLYSGCLLLGGMMNICIPMLYINKDKYTYTNNAHINSFRSMFSLIPMLKVCWSVNGVVQGAGGPALSKITIDFFPAQHRSRAWSALLTVGMVCGVWCMV
ncbi:MFS transporter [archaeon]|nr:MAG: MFS transporter [archaeon]